MTAAETRTNLETAGLVAIVRGNFTPEDVLAIGEALVRGGITAIEVTLNTTYALEALTLLTRLLGDRALVGAGTVLTPEQVDEAAAAGARYLIAPGIDSDCIARAREHDLLFVPGVFTATEIDRALKQGCELLKLFPASEMRPGYLTAMSGPFPQARFMATGGIGLAEIEPYYRAGAVAFGLGSSLVKTGKTSHAVETMARLLVDELLRVRTKNGVA